MYTATAVHSSTNLTFSVYQSHICDTAQTGHLHSNPHILQCKIQMQTSQF